MHLPEELVKSLEGIKGFDKKAFKEIHGSGEQVTSIRINPYKLLEARSERVNEIFHDSRLTSQKKIPWAEHGYYLSQRPSFTFDPFFHAGCYYVQEASSMFIEQVLKQTIDLSRSIKVLDLCAAPGGKSTHIQSLISKDSLLVSNEVIRSRSNILKDNIIKWGCANVVMTNNDPKDFAKLENYFDVIVVDAPCSGSGLFRKEREAIGEWSLNNVNLCSGRQQRILADVWPSLKKNGVLIYSTCSYSKEENEDIVNWMIKELRTKNKELIIDPEWGIVKSETGYRFWPDKVKGEGFFIACFQKTDGEEDSFFKTKNKTEQAIKSEIKLINKWVTATQHQFVKRQNTVHAIPEKLMDEINILSAKLHVVYFGTAIGEIIRDKLIPDHALAMSSLVSDSIQTAELNYDEAIEYLKKKSLDIKTASTGWQLVTYHGFKLGWINVLSNRINNYYPKELRILKDS